MKLSQGTHKVKLYNDSGATKVRTIVIEPGRIKTITVNFEEDTIEETN